MRLINTATFEVQRFPDPKKRPKYAILSHKWLDDEITFQQLSDFENYTHLQGYRKVYAFCRIAQEHNYSWAWVDTCCIDRTDPTELQESINSMFAWYKDSDTCFVYLHDLPSADFDDMSNDELQDNLEPCKWFTRGWTLQELVAPKHVWFFDQTWHKFGSRYGLARVLSEITNIEVELLKNKAKLRQFSIAQKMSWAAFRQTSRIEDRAYSLLGLFGVNMSLLYGEGHNAFFRLQKTLMEHSSDQSILAWNLPYEDPQVLSAKSLRRGMPSCILAPSPDCFYKGAIVPFNMKRSRPDRDLRIAPDVLRESCDTPFQVTNRGLRITLYAKKIGSLLSETEDGVIKHRDVYKALLNCFDYNRPNEHAMLIHLVQAVRGVTFRRSDPYLLRASSCRSTVFTREERRDWNNIEFLIDPVWKAPLVDLKHFPSEETFTYLEDRRRECEETLELWMNRGYTTNAADFDYSSRGRGGYRPRRWQESSYSNYKAPSPPYGENTDSEEHERSGYWSGEDDVPDLTRRFRRTGFGDY